MNVFECYCERKNREISCDIFSLFSEFNIPLHEQLILLNMAKKNQKSGCEELKNILLHLKKNNNLKSEQ